MKKLQINFSLLITAFIFYTSNIHAQVCSTPGKDGDNLTLSGTVNSYWAPSNGIYNSLSTFITINTRRGASTNISPGDLVLIIQTQCADIDITDTDAYGDGVSGDMAFGSPIASGYIDPVGSCLAGEYEYLRAGPATTASNLDLTENPLVNTYVQANTTNTTGLRRFQVIRVPQYENATLNGTVNSVSWNGLTGGIVALDIANQLEFNGNIIDVDGFGFRGAAGRARSANNPTVRYRSILDSRHGLKGEGIVSTPRYVSNNRSAISSATTSIIDLNTTGTGFGYPSGTASPADFARGAPGNAGGGGTFWDGTSDNGGGGAGGNGGAGGRGGAGWRSAGYTGINIDFSNLIDQKWGFGGNAFASSVSRLIFGGGGGAGDNNNNSTAVESSGAAGGGIVLIRAREVLGTGTINARGAIAPNNSSNDAAGAGGAGGSIIIVSSDMNASTLTLNAAGGRGGDAWLTGTPARPPSSAHGPGGGGGGGAVYLTGSATVDVTGGANGLTNTNDTNPSLDGANHGSKPGNTGTTTMISVPDDTPGINTGFRCLDYGDAPSSYGLANHNLNAEPNELLIGSISPDGDSSILTAIPSTNANTDDLDNTSDEDGVSLPSAAALSGEYTAVVDVFNNSSTLANLCGWIDFDQDGIFQSDEAQCTTVTSMASSQSINMVFTVPITDRTNTGQIISRFRLSTDSLNTSTPTGMSTDGEVEDHTVTVTTLPVSVYKFNSRLIGDRLDINWGTASETRNAGFNIWGVNDSGTVKLNKQMIASKSTGVLKSTQYNDSFFLDGQYFDEIALSAIDIRGQEEIFGYFKIGEKIGRNHTIKNIDWKTINSKNNRTILNNKLALQKTVNKSSSQMKTFITPNKSGMQQVTHEDLLAKGIDLTGIKYDDIAITINKQPYARFIGKNNQFTDVIFKDSYETTQNLVFGPNSKIEFWAKPAHFPDAEYLDFYTYEISVAPEMVKKHKYQNLKSSDYNSHYLHQLIDNKDNEYGFIVASVDPWFAKRLVSFSNDEAKQYNVDFEIDSAFNSSEVSSIEVVVSGGTALPANPDHEVSIFVNNQLINTTQFDGVTEKIITSEIPLNILQSGSNQVSVRLTNGVDVAFDIVNVDKITLSYARALKAMDGILNVPNIYNEKPLLVSNIENTENQFALYSFEADELFILESQVTVDNSLMVANNRSNKGSYWVSGNQKLNQPSIKPVNSNTELSVGNANYLIIAHPAFMPVNENESHPLNDYISVRKQEGWNIKLVSIEDIQTEYGGGMNLPGAITTYLQINQINSNIDHILLIGNDTYDYKNNLGINSTSYIPTKYTPTVYIPHTPSDALLTDLNGDGLPNISIGRWPIRSMTDLDNTVHKTLNWSTATDLSAIFITDIEETDALSFESQANRIANTITKHSGENIDIVEIFPNSIELNPGENAVDKSRGLMFQSWQTKHSLSNFLGHGSPTQWSRQGILASGDLTALNNENHPTLIGTLSCYSSYFVSPISNSLSLNLMNGANGIPNGAVAIHGAATLSSYSGNEVFANHVLEMQLNGKTLGEAILSARNLSHSLGYFDQVKNWTLLGDPTLRISVE